jgi:hexosaminidase
MHLTEDAGWRMEIKRYPKLTTIGAFRKGTQLNREGRNDGRPHGGFYTQDDLREIIAFAGARGVHVLPEIDMPGHSTAAIVAYPELGTSGAATEVPRMWGSPDVLNMEPRTVQFTKDVLTEVADLFPFSFVHIGGDEARWELWKASKLVQARREALGLKDEAALQAWFTRQLDAHLTSKKKRLIGWDEILEGGLAPGATVMAWRGTAGGIKAAKMGHDVVMAPTSHTYFDYYQSQDTANEPPAIGGFLPLQRVYDFEPIPAELTPTEAKHILGAQGQIWGEYLTDNRHAEYLTFPRACALAEVTWSPREGKDYGAFLRRLRLHRARLDALGIQYRPLEER